jgi:NADH-quinone oxidoreductase subunit G
MPKLIIDDRQIEVAPGTKVIAAAEQIGIVIPRFCYHPALGSVGACRVCAVKFMDGPVRGLQMSCMVDARDGMVVSTTDRDAMDFRRQVIEWLMLNHPHDCPVCDEGGHCLLQDQTVAGGHGARRYLGMKRTYRDQYLGELVQHEMNRCIHCYRCRRFYQDAAGYRDFGAMQIGNRTYFGRFRDGPLESPFAGNLIDLCPTGVFTDKPSRFKGRRWDFERAPSVCLHCSLGCATTASARYREVVRVEGRWSEPVNGHFICDRGRYGYGYTNHSGRPREASIGKHKVSYDDAILAVADRLKSVRNRSGAESIGSATSVRASLETMMQLRRLARGQKWREPTYFLDAFRQVKTAAAVERLTPDLAVSLQDVGTADLVLVVGCDPLNEAPMLAFSIRQAVRAGAKVVVIDPRPVSLPFEFARWPAMPGELTAILHAVTRTGVPVTAAEPFGAWGLTFLGSLPKTIPGGKLAADRLRVVSAWLRSSRRPVIVCGTDVVYRSTISAAADLALLLGVEKKGAGLFHVMPGANAFGAALVGADSTPFSQLLVNIEQGEVKALVLVESDPLNGYPDERRVRAALKRLEFLVVVDYLPNRALDLAHVVLPSLSVFETPACFINQEGRLRVAAAAHRGGAPMEQSSGGDPPPLDFHKEHPGSDARAAWQVLAELEATVARYFRVTSYRGLWSQIAMELNVPLGEGTDWGITDGHRVGFKASDVQPFATVPADAAVEQDMGELGLILLRVDWLHGTEELSAYSDIVPKVEAEPRLLMHPDDATRRGLVGGERVVVRFKNDDCVPVDLSLADTMARGVAIMPRHRRLPWQQGGEEGSVVVSVEREP